LDLEFNALGWVDLFFLWGIEVSVDLLVVLGDKFLRILDSMEMNVIQKHFLLRHRRHLADNKSSEESSHNGKQESEQ